MTALLCQSHRVKMAILGIQWDFAYLLETTVSDVEFFEFLFLQILRV